MADDNLWPTSVPDFKAAITGYYGEVLQLARRLIRVFAVALDLPENYFDAMVSRPGALANIVHYPPQPPTDPSIGISPHTDYECFTILCQSNQAGLQVLNPQGEWIMAPPIPGTFVVNIGDMLQRWSNNLFLSTAHRVINITGEERYSIPLFFGPNYDTIIEPLSTCFNEERPAQYKPVLAGQYVFDRLAEAQYRNEEKEKGHAILLTA
jgi:isopenicillin N synthase-like dioxygenase